MKVTMPLYAVRGTPACKGEILVLSNQWNRLEGGMDCGMERCLDVSTGNHMLLSAISMSKQANAIIPNWKTAAKMAQEVS